MDNEELIQSFRTMIEELQNSQKELSEKLDGILNEAADAKRSYDKEQFVGRNKDFFDKYRDDVKAVEGDDFDFDETVFGGKGDMDETDYIAALSEKLDAQLSEMANKLSHLTGEKVEKVEAKTEDIDGDGETDTTEIEAKPENEDKSDEKSDDKSDDKSEDEPKEPAKEESEKVAEEEKEEEKPVKNEEMSEAFRKRFAAMY